MADMPRWLNELCDRVVARVRTVSGVKAIALGGSQARGTAREDSDVDIGIYYDSSAPFSIPELDAAARDLDERHTAGIVTGFGEWGPGVNGGGWLLIDGRHVDFLYRDLDRVREVIEQCIAGKPSAVYQIGHPMGFQNQIYLAETHFNRILYDPEGKLGALKEMVALYPESMRLALIRKHLFDAAFEIDIAAKPAARGDVAYVALCLARASGFMMLVLYAMNERYFANEKGAFLESMTFASCPPGLHQRIAQVLGWIDAAPPALADSVATMRTECAILRALCVEKFGNVVMA